jgi:hypothetical protein
LRQAREDGIDLSSSKIGVGADDATEGGHNQDERQVEAEGVRTPEYSLE